MCVLLVITSSPGFVAYKVDGDGDGDGDRVGRVFYSNYRQAWVTQSYEADRASELLYQ